MFNIGVTEFKQLEMAGFDGDPIFLTVSVRLGVGLVPQGTVCHPCHFARSCRLLRLEADTLPW